MPTIITRGAASAKGFGFQGGPSFKQVTYSASPYTPPQGDNNSSSSPRYWLTYGFINAGASFKLKGFTVTSRGYPANGAICFSGSWYFRVLTGASTSTLTQQFQSSIVNSFGGVDQYTTTETFEVLIPSGEYFVLYFLSSAPNTTQYVNHYVATANSPNATYSVGSNLAGYEIYADTSLTMVNYPQSNSGPPSNPITYALANLPSNCQKNGAQWSFVLNGISI